jgi:hypothetical protein
VCDLDYMEEVTLWREDWRTARKGHRCSACRGPVAPGERYVVHFSVFDGSAASEKICGLCYADRGEFAQDHESLIPVPSAFLDALVECVDEGPEEKARWGPVLDNMRARQVAA